MLDFLILSKNWGKETGVSVSIQHLCQLMKTRKMSFEAKQYEDDYQLLELVENSLASVVMLQVPSFGQDTLSKLLTLKREITLVIHSTIAFMQAEEGVLDRVIKYMSLTNDNWSICNPSESEVSGFSSYLPAKIFHLPNTFNPLQSNLSLDKPTEATIHSRYDNPKRVSIFCEHRPFKNLLTQITALSIAAKNLDIELHLIRPTKPNEIYKYVRTMTELMPFSTVWHDPAKNSSFFALMQNIALGMQVSYTETFSYVTYEHMIHGIPTVASTAVPFATLHPAFNDSYSIAEAISAIFRDNFKYVSYSMEAWDKACEVRQRNNLIVEETLHSLLRRAERWT